ncbi:fumarate/nitrate reduction transcriptional regulator Fnr [Marinobacter sp.]|uniref:fumarate/nitrate reduction transcriptional regulator Fnr n=1 Tax=Marinobacter sp. TaxID=50741 RepID=UPI00384EC66B
MGQPIARSHPSALKASCHSCSLSELCLPIAVGASDIDRLEDIIQQGRSFSRGETVFKQSERARSCFAVRSGAIKTSVVNHSGEEQVTGFFLPGEIMGLDSISDDRYACSAFVLERTSVCELPISHLEELSRKLPSLQHHFFSLMSSEIRHSQQHAMLLSRNTAEERIASLLLSLSSRFERRKLSPTRFTLPMARNDIANFLGLAVETVSRVMTRFQGQGLIQAKGREIELLDLTALQEIALTFARCRP